MKSFAMTIGGLVFLMTPIMGGCVSDQVTTQPSPRGFVASQKTKPGGPAETAPENPTWAAGELQPKMVMVKDLQTFGQMCLAEAWRQPCRPEKARYGCLHLHYVSKENDDLGYGQPQLVLDAKKVNSEFVLLSCYRYNIDSRNCPILFKRHCPQTWAQHHRVFQMDQRQLTNANAAKASDLTDPEKEP